MFILNFIRKTSFFLLLLFVCFVSLYTKIKFLIGVQVPEDFSLRKQEKFLDTTIGNIPGKKGINLATSVLVSHEGIFEISIPSINEEKGLFFAERKNHLVTLNSKVKVNLFWGNSKAVKKMLSDCLDCMEYIPPITLVRKESVTTAKKLPVEYSVGEEAGLSSKTRRRTITSQKEIKPVKKKEGTVPVQQGKSADAREVPQTGVSPVVEGAELPPIPVPLPPKVDSKTTQKLSGQTSRIETSDAEDISQKGVSPSIPPKVDLQTTQKPSGQTLKVDTSEEEVSVQKRVQPVKIINSTIGINRELNRIFLDSLLNNSVFFDFLSESFPTRGQGDETVSEYLKKEILVLKFSSIEDPILETFRMNNFLISTGVDFHFSDYYKFFLKFLTNYFRPLILGANIDVGSLVLKVLENLKNKEKDASKTFMRIDFWGKKSMTFLDCSFVYSFSCLLSDCFSSMNSSRMHSFMGRIMKDFSVNDLGWFSFLREMDVLDTMVSVSPWLSLFLSVRDDYVPKEYSDVFNASGSVVIKYLDKNGKYKLTKNVVTILAAPGFALKFSLIKEGLVRKVIVGYHSFIKLTLYKTKKSFLAGDNMLDKISFSGALWTRIFFGEKNPVVLGLKIELNDWRDFRTLSKYSLGLDLSFLF